MPVITTACTRCSGMLEEGDRFCQDCGFRLDHILRSPLLESPDADEHADSSYSSHNKERSAFSVGGLPGFKAFGLRSSLRSPISVPEWLLVVAMTVYSGTTIYTMQKNHPNWFGSTISKISSWAPTLPKPSGRKATQAPLPAVTAGHAGVSEVDKLFQLSKKHASTTATTPSITPEVKPSRSGGAAAPVVSPIVPAAAVPQVRHTSFIIDETVSGGKESVSKKFAEPQVGRTAPLFTNPQATATQPNESNSSPATTSNAPLTFTSDHLKRHESAAPSTDTSGAVKKPARHGAHSSPASSAVVPVTSTAAPVQKSEGSNTAVEEQPSEANWEVIPEAPVKKPKAKPITKKEVGDVTEYNKQLARYFSEHKGNSTEAPAKGGAGATDGTTGSAPSGEREPPSYEEWLKGGKDAF